MYLLSTLRVFFPKKMFAVQLYFLENNSFLLVPSICCRLVGGMEKTHFVIMHFDTKLIGSVTNSLIVIMYCNHHQSNRFIVSVIFIDVH